MLSHDFYGMFINSNGLTAKLWNVQARFISDPVTWIIFNVPIVYLKYCFLCSASGCWETGNLLQKIWTKASTQTAHCSRPSWRILWSSWVWPIQRLCWVQADLFRTLEFSLKCKWWICFSFVCAAFEDMLENPLNSTQWMNDPETGPVMLQISRIFQTLNRT